MSDFQIVEIKDGDATVLECPQFKHFKYIIGKGETIDQAKAAFLAALEKEDPALFTKPAPQLSEPAKEPVTAPPPPQPEVEHIQPQFTQPAAEPVPIVETHEGAASVPADHVWARKIWGEVKKVAKDVEEL